MDLECPYCGADQEVCHDDGQNYDQDVNHEMECSKCGKRFVFRTSITFSYDAEKADCLNDGKHVYRPTHTSPSCFTQMECQSCGERRELTESERVTLGIPSKKEYWEQIKI